MKSVICISGKAQHGKDTVARVMKEHLEAQGRKVLITHYADLLKYVCKTYFGWGGNKDNYGRNLLQKVGTDIVRSKDPDFWASFIVNILKFFGDEWDYVIIPDTRFPNEIDRLDDAGFDTVLIRVNRLGFDNGIPVDQQNHSSEKALDKYSADFLLLNDKDLNELHRKATDMAGFILLKERLCGNT